MASVKKAKGKSARGSAKGPVAEIGVIGGSGLYGMSGLTDTREIRVKTPFGDPSDAFVIGTLEGKRVAFLARHGRGHRLLPSELNFRANIYAMKLLGVERVISVSAVGSLQEELRPGEFLVPDQFFDRTKGRASTFFGNGLVAHVRATVDSARRCLCFFRRSGSPQGHLRLHGRAAILHPRGS
jgi:purine nucleoside phosphorylase